MSVVRKTRSDKKVGAIEKELGIQLYGANGRKIRKDKTLSEVRKQQGVTLSSDQKLTANIEIKIPPKANLARVNKVSKVVKKLNKND